MSVQHTPGPWIAISGGSLGDLEFDDDSDCDDRWHIGQAVEGQPGYVIAIVHNGAPGDTLETEGANAHLIAAAPDLLAALKASVENHCPNDRLFCSTCTPARVVIAKAEGRADEADAPIKRRGPA